MDQSRLNKDQEIVINRVQFSYDMLSEKDLVSNLLGLLCDSLPNNYDLGSVVRDLVLRERTNSKNSIKNKIL